MKPKNSRIKMYRLASLCCVFLLGISALSTATAEESLDVTAWRDDFKGSNLDPVWTWQNENPDKWHLTGEFLRIQTSSLPTGGENLLLRPVTEGDFEIETRLIFEPDTNFQFAGLVIFQDNENFLQFGRAFCDIEEFCTGNAIYFDKVLGGGSADGNFSTPVDIPDEAFLRLERPRAEPDPAL